MVMIAATHDPSAWDKTGVPMKFSRPVGADGMGEVYRASDTKLGRAAI
jgi:hypothetical protein